MKTHYVSIASMFVLVLQGWAEPAKSNPDPVSRHLLPPELILHFGDQLGLSQEQRLMIQGDLEAAQGGFKERQAALEAEMRALDRLLDSGDSSEEKVLARLDKMLDAERAIKRLHLGTLLKVRAHLTPEQIAAAQELKKRHESDQGAKRKRQLEAKLERVQRGVETLVNEGESPREIAELMNRFPALMEAGKIDEAEALLDKTLKKIGEKEPELN